MATAPVVSDEPPAPERLAAFFTPDSIALIGATDRSRWSVNTFNNWVAHTERPIYLVHPVHETVHSQRAYPSLSAIGEPVDLAYVMVPTEQVLPVLTEAAEVGIRNVVILTAGFAEMGPEGRAVESRLVDLARDHKMVILGPNGNGFINATDKRTPYGLSISPPLVSGPVGIVLQSGGLASNILAMAQARGIGVSHVVSMGNEAMLSATDVITYLVAHEETRCIATFLESIRQPDAFRAAAEAALRAGKPIVALKVGRTTAGRQAALAHTGAVVGDASVVRAALEDIGVVQVDSLEDLLTTAGFLSKPPGRLGRRLGVVAGSGGACDIIADRATDEGIELPNFPETTLSRLQELLPPYANPQNPLDVTGYAVIDPKLARTALDVVLDDAIGHFDSIMFHFVIPKLAPPDPERVLTELSELADTLANAPVPVILQTGSGSSGAFTEFQTTVMQRFGFNPVDGIDHGMTAIGRALWWQEMRERRLARRVVGVPEAVTLPADARGTWGEGRSRALLAEHGVPVVPTRIVSRPEDAVTAAEQCGFPVALKIASEQLLHKSDVGGVALDLRGGEEVARAAQTLLDVAFQRKVGVEGLQVAPMRSGGVELFVSVKRDPTWGPVLAVGLGGIWVEALGDTALRLLPVAPDDVESMLDSLKGSRLLEGRRGRTPVDRASLVAAIAAIARLGESLGDKLDTLEVNPLWAGSEGAEALDALVIWSS